MLDEMSDLLPSMKTVLVDERDRYMAQHLRQAPGKRLVAVVGAAHVPGILRRLNEPGEPDCLVELAQIPPKPRLSKILPWIIPAVVVGLTLYLLLSHQGPVGDLRLLFTQKAMVLGQIALSLPILVAMSHAALQGGDKRAWETARTLGASRLRTIGVVLFEARFGVMAAILAGFGRIIAEVGASLMLGGNIAGYTRNIPTAIALETSKGEYAQGIALGIVLLFFSFGVNLIFHHFQGHGQVRQQ